MVDIARFDFFHCVGYAVWDARACLVDVSKGDAPSDTMTETIWRARAADENETALFRLVFPSGRTVAIAAADAAEAVIDAWLLVDTGDVPMSVRCYDPPLIGAEGEPVSLPEEVALVSDALCADTRALCIPVLDMLMQYFTEAERLVRENETRGEGTLLDAVLRRGRAVANDLSAMECERWAARKLFPRLVAAKQEVEALFLLCRMEWLNGWDYAFPHSMYRFFAEEREKIKSSKQ